MPIDFSGALAPAKKKRKKKTSMASAAAVELRPPTANSTLAIGAASDGQSAKKTKRKKERAGGADKDPSAYGSAGPSLVAASQDSTGRGIKSSAALLDDLFASLPGKKAMRDAKKREREEQEALDGAAAAKKKLPRKLPRDPIFGEEYATPPTAY